MPGNDTFSEFRHDGNYASELSQSGERFSDACDTALEKDIEAGMMCHASDSYLLEESDGNCGAMFPGCFCGVGNAEISMRLRIIAWYHGFFRDLGSVSGGTEQVEKYLNRIKSSLKNHADDPDVNSDTSVFTKIEDELISDWKGDDADKFEEFIDGAKEAIRNQYDIVCGLEAIMKAQGAIIQDARENYLTLLNDATEAIQFEADSGGGGTDWARTGWTLLGTALAAYPKTAVIGAAILGTGTLYDAINDDNGGNDTEEEKFPEMYNGYLFLTLDSFIENLKNLYTKVEKQLNGLKENAAATEVGTKGYDPDQTPQNDDGDYIFDGDAQRARVYVTAPPVPILGWLQTRPYNTRCSLEANRPRGANLQVGRFLGRRLRD